MFCHRDVAVVGIHDDWYFELAAADVSNFWKDLKTMTACNHRMSADKCKVLIEAATAFFQLLLLVLGMPLRLLP